MRALIALVLLTLLVGSVQAHETPPTFARVPDPGPRLAPATPRPTVLPLRDVRPAPVRPHVTIPESPVIVHTIPQVHTGGLEPSGHQASGTASYYCTPANPICHHAYPVGSMVAAACGKLRRAIGPDWRGRRVTVRYGSRSVSVVLVDWCGSSSKTIDLYGAPFSRLAPLSRGVISIMVSW